MNEFFRALSHDTDMGWVFIDGNIVRALQHSCGERTADNESIGKSRGGNFTKIYLAVDSTTTLLKEHPRSFSKVVGYARSALSTVEKLTSESFIKEYQAKAVEFLKSQDTPLIKTQA